MCRHVALTPRVPSLIGLTIVLVCVKYTKVKHQMIRYMQLGLDVEVDPNSNPS